MPYRPFAIPKWFGFSLQSQGAQILGLKSGSPVIQTEKNVMS